MVNNSGKNRYACVLPDLRGNGFSFSPLRMMFAVCFVIYGFYYVELVSLYAHFLESFHHKWVFSSVAQSCPTLCDPMNRSILGLPVHHQFPESTQTHVHRVSDAIQPSHPLPSPSPPALNLSQHQGLFKWVSSSHQVAKVLGVSASTSVLPMNIQGWFPLGGTSWISLQSKGLSRVFSNTTVQIHQFFGAQLSL